MRDHEWIRYRKCILPVAVAGLAILTACSNEQNTTSESMVVIDEPSEILFQKKNFTFSSERDVVMLSDEELINLSSTMHELSDFTQDIVEVDRFGVTSEAEGETGIEYVKNAYEHSEDFVSGKSGQQIAEEYIDSRIEQWDTMDYDRNRGRSVLEPEKIFCGENQYYIEYLLTYTEKYIQGENGKDVTYINPKAQRFVFMKNVEYDYTIGVTRINGDLSIDAVREQLDVVNEMSKSYGAILRTVEEKRDSYEYVVYGVNIKYNDFGIKNVAQLLKWTSVISKTDGSVTAEPVEILKQAEIEGSEDEGIVFDE